MATKRVCDRCGAEISPVNFVTYAGMRRVKTDINDNDYELCVSCAHKLRKWFNGEDKPMAKYIRAVEAAEKVAGTFKVQMADLVDIFAEIPDADVAPVVHGRWIRPHWKNNNYCCDCSECGVEAMHRDYQWHKNGVYPICPNCGAKMDGGNS